MTHKTKLTPNQPNIIWVSTGLRIENKTYQSVPLLLDRNYNPVHAASNWLRTLTLSGKHQESSIAEYAKTLRNFWHFLDRTNTNWTDVNDVVLRNWRNNQSQDGVAIEKHTINSKLTVVLRFYLWSQTCGYLTHVIGQPDHDTQFFPPISISFKKGRYGATCITSEILYRVHIKQPKHVPSAKEMDRVHLALANSNFYGVALRNCLILNWAELTGTRRIELLGLRITDIPSWDKIYELRDNDQIYRIEIVGKRGKVRSLNIAYPLLISTRDYIEGERKQIVQRRHLDDHGYVFIAHTTGAHLDEDYCSHLISNAFRKANVKGTLHRGRARFLTRIVSQCLDDAISQHGLNGLSLELILLKAAELAGHTSIETLRYYLKFELKHRYDSTETVSSLNEKRVAAARAADQEEIRLNQNQTLRKLSEALTSKDADLIRNTYAILGKQIAEITGQLI